MAHLGGYRVVAESKRSGPPISEEDLGRAGEYIQSLYDNGTTFFNKEHIRRIGYQLAEAAKTGETIWVSVDGLDGVPVEFEVQVGRKAPAIGSPLESVT